MFKELWDIFTRLWKEQQNQISENLVHNLVNYLIRFSWGICWFSKESGEISHQIVHQIFTNLVSLPVSQKEICFTAGNSRKRLFHMSSTCRPWSSELECNCLLPKDSWLENHKVLAYSLESTTSDINKIDISAVSGWFPKVKMSDLVRPEGSVDLLLGLNYTNVHLHPELKTVENLQLLKSQFGTGYLVDGIHPKVKTTSVWINHLAHKYEQKEVSLTAVRRVNKLQSFDHVPPKRIDHLFPCHLISGQAWIFFRLWLQGGAGEN